MRTPGNKTILCQLHDLLLIRCVALSDCKLSLCAAQIEIRPRHLGRDTYLYIVQIVLRRFGERSLRVHVARDAAEDVHLPRCIEADVPELLRGQLSGETRCGR